MNQNFFFLESFNEKVIFNKKDVMALQSLDENIGGIMEFDSVDDGGGNVVKGGNMVYSIVVYMNDGTDKYEGSQFKFCYPDKMKRDFIFIGMKQHIND